jgi:hypothetical protein
LNNGKKQSLIYTLINKIHGETIFSHPVHKIPGNDCGSASFPGWNHSSPFAKLGIIYKFAEAL